MYHCKALIVMALIGFVVNAQTINLHGKVSNGGGKPVAGAIVTLVGQGLMDTTGSDGTYLLSKNNVAVVPVLTPRSKAISMDNGFLALSLPNTSPVRIDIFDVKGKLLKNESLSKVPAGFYRFNIAADFPATMLLVIRVAVGRDEVTFRHVPINNGKYSVNSTIESTEATGSSLAKITAISDTLKIVAAGYAIKTLAITSYEQELAATLDTATATLSEGCGKTPPASGVKTSMDVGGTKREYLLKLPSNYDSKKSYMLIFCPHWMGGKIEDVVSGGACGGPYYGLEKLANNTAIFVLPQGLSSGSSTGFPNTKGQDVKFFEELLKYCNANLCIDQKRIFSVGFSYGGMMSLAAGCAMPDVFRAIAPMSGAFYSGCDSTSKGPVAVWQAHGTSDNVVPIANGKNALQYYLARNGCGNQTKAVEPSPCVEYQGCKEGYPVTFCEFSGGHGVQSFAAAAIWKFFSQF